MKTITAVLVSLIISLCEAHGQDSSSVKRAPYHLTVLVDKKNVYEEDLKEGPYIFPDKTIQLYPGESIYVEVEVENSIIKNMKIVKEMTDSAKTLTISLTQTAKTNVHELMMLKIHNPFKYNLTYKATMFLLQNKKWVNTDVFPIEAGLTAFETWPDIIISIGLGKWAFATK